MVELAGAIPEAVETGRHRKADKTGLSELIEAIAWWMVMLALSLLAIKPFADIPGEKMSSDSVDLGTVVTLVGAFAMIGAVFGVRTWQVIPKQIRRALLALGAVLVMSGLSYLLIRHRADVLALFDVRPVIIAGAGVAPPKGVAAEAARLISSFAPIALIGLLAVRADWFPAARLRLVCSVILAGAGVHCAWAWLQIAGIVDYTFFFDAPGVHFGRASGGYYHPMSLGRLLIFAMVFIYLLRHQLGIKLWQRYAMLAVLLGTGIVTLHRITIVCLAMVLVAFELPWLRRFRLRDINRKLALRLGAAGVLGLAGVALLWGDTIWSRLKFSLTMVGSLNPASDRFLHGRGAIWGDYLRVLGKAPIDAWLIGFGYEPWDSHNDFLRVGVIWGILGLIATAIAIVAVYRYTRSQLSAEGQRDLIALYLTAFVFGLTQQPMAYPYFMWLFFFSHVLLLAFYRAEAEPVTRPLAHSLTAVAAVNVPNSSADTQRARGVVPRHAIADRTWLTAKQPLAPPRQNPPGTPTFSVCIVVRDRPDLLVRAVQSVLCNTMREFELVIVDDGSAIPVRQVMQEAGLATDPRLRVIAQAPSGVSPARNNALRVARGTYVTVLDSDDELAPDALERLAALISTTGCSWAYTDYHEIVKDRPRRIKLPAFPTPQRMLTAVLTRPRVPFKHSGMTMRRDLAVGLGGYNESLRMFGDVDLVLRGLSAGVHPHHLDYPAVVFYRHSGNLTRNRFVGIGEWFELIDHYGPAHKPLRAMAFKTVRAMSEVGKWFVSIVA